MDYTPIIRFWMMHENPLVLDLDLGQGDDQIEPRNDSVVQRMYTVGFLCDHISFEKGKIASKP